MFVTGMLAWILTILLTFYLGMAGGVLGYLMLALLLTLPIAVLLLMIYPPRAQGALHTNFWLAAGALVLAGLLVPTSLLTTGELTPLPQALEIVTSLLLFLLPFLAVMAAMLLLYTGLTLLKAPKPEAAAPEPAESIPRWQAWAALLLSAALLIKLGHNLYNLFLWDATVDSLGILWLAPWLLTAILSGLALTIRLPGWQKLVGAAFAILAPLYMYGIYSGASQVDYRQLTEDRAARIQQAIEVYYDRSGAYPAALDQLTPRDLWSVPAPVIIPGQEWCYDSQGSYYRLGYITRQHWSDPNLHERLFASSAGAPQEPGVCRAEIQALIDSQPGYYRDARDEP